VKLKEKIIDLIIQHLPDADYLTIEQVCKLGILGIVPEVNLSYLRRNYRGPKSEKRGKITIYPKKDFIDWLKNHVKFHVTDIKR